MLGIFSPKRASAGGPARTRYGIRSPHLLDARADIRSVQELLGHRSLGTTQVYAPHVTTTRLHDTYRAAHPRAKGKTVASGRVVSGGVVSGGEWSKPTMGEQPMNKTKLTYKSPLTTHHSPLTILVNTLVLAACARRHRSVHPMATRLQFGRQGGDRKGPANPDRFRHRELPCGTRARTEHAPRLGHRPVALNENFVRFQDGPPSANRLWLRPCGIKQYSDPGVGRPGRKDHRRARRDFRKHAVHRSTAKSLGLLWHPKWIDPRLSGSVESRLATEYGRAVTLLKNVVQDGKERPVQVRGSECAARLEQQAAGRLVRAEEGDSRPRPKHRSGRDIDRFAAKLHRDSAATDGGALLTTLAIRPRNPRPTAAAAGSRVARPGSR